MLLVDPCGGFCPRHKVSLLYMSLAQPGRVVSTDVLPGFNRPHSTSIYWVTTLCQVAWGSISEQTEHTWNRSLAQIPHACSFIFFVAGRSWSELKSASKETMHRRLSYHGRMLGSIPGCYPLDISNAPLPFMTNRKVSEYFQVFWGVCGGITPNWAAIKVMSFLTLGQHYWST